MYKRIYFLFFYLIFAQFSFSQKLIIEIFERQELTSFRNTTIDSVIINPDFVDELEVTKTTYVIDFNEKTSSYFVGEEFLSVLPIEVVKTTGSYTVIKILEEGFDYGLIIDLTYENESVLWYWNAISMTSVKKITKFNIVKSS